MSSATKHYIVVEVVHMILCTEDVYHTCTFTTSIFQSQKTLSAGFIIGAFIFPFQTKSPKSLRFETALQSILSGDKIKPEPTLPYGPPARHRSCFLSLLLQEVVW